MAYSLNISNETLEFSIIRIKIFWLTKLINETFDLSNNMKLKQNLNEENIFLKS